MTTTINAQATNGLLTTADGSGIVKLQSNGVATNALLWCNYAGNTPSTRSSYNTSSVTKVGTGRYYFTSSAAYSDSNYTLMTTGSVDIGASNWMNIQAHATNSNPYYIVPTTSVFYVICNWGNSASNVLDPVYTSVSVFGN